jgi:hypothetical protein
VKGSKTAIHAGEPLVFQENRSFETLQDTSRGDGDSDGYGRSPREQERLHCGASATARGRVPEDSPPRRRHHRGAHWSELLQSDRQALDVCAVVRRELWRIGQRE